MPLLAGCGSHSKPKPAPTLSAVLAHEKSVHFVANGTVKIELQSLVAHLHHVPPFKLHADGDASRYGLKASGGVQGGVSGTGTAIVVGKEGFGRAQGTWYSLGDVTKAAQLLRGATWTSETGPGGRPRVLNASLHLTTNQLEQLSGLKLPFGVEGADVDLHLRLSRWGERVTITRPRYALPLPHG